MKVHESWNIHMVYFKISNMKRMIYEELDWNQIVSLWRVRMSTFMYKWTNFRIQYVKMLIDYTSAPPTSKNCAALPPFRLSIYFEYWEKSDFKLKMIKSLMLVIMIGTITARRKGSVRKWCSKWYLSQK